MTLEEKLDEILRILKANQQTLEWIEDTIRGMGFGRPRVLPGNGEVKR